MTHLKHLFWLGVTAQLLSACSNQPKTSQTLADIDRPTRTAAAAQAKPAIDNPEVTKSAYYDYLQSAAADDEARAHAALRIAELELSGATNLASDEQAFDAGVRETIKLLRQALKDFPRAPGNDQRLYQLAKAFDQVGEADRAVETLQTLVQHHPETPHFAEVQFRLAEHAFVSGHYSQAEAGYSRVLDAEAGEAFVERALFKRGWTRFKQERFKAALDDFFAALNAHGAPDLNEAQEGERALLDEYFRAVALSFSYLGGAPALADYFQRNPQSPYIYRAYAGVSDMLLERERFSDAVAVLDDYSVHYPDGDGVVSAGMRAVSIWKNSNFRSRFEQAFSKFYEHYRPGAPYWSNAKADGAVPTEFLRENLLLIAARYHNRYLAEGQAQDFATASSWYERYLHSLASYARQDKIYPLYAQLLERRGQVERALGYYELAAFDGDIVLDKEAAYAGIYLTDQLLQKSQDRIDLLDKHLNYSRRFAQLYPQDSRTQQTVKHAAEVAFNRGRFETTVELMTLLPDSAPQSVRQELGLLKGQALSDLGRLKEAELVYRDLLDELPAGGPERSLTIDKLALSVYQQGDLARKQKDPTAAALHFLRVYQNTPQSELAPTALYDAIALWMAQKQWDDAIHYLNVFNQVYPGHSLHTEVNKKLSFAYLESGRSLEAAQAFESLARVVETEEEKMAALWQAAELYSSKGERGSAIRAYETYVSHYQRPYPQYVEAMHRLAGFYASDGNLQSDYWLTQIVQQDASVNAALKTERTDYLAASAAFSLAKKQLKQFESIALVHPLATSLQKKKSAMQTAVKLYGQAAAHGHQDFVTESTYRIASIYRDFARALLNSERPGDLAADELEQYNILLEDQAFPFEDQAIKFFETNMGRVGQGVYDDWIEKSLHQLAELFPARYNRRGKTEAFVERL